MKEMAGQNPQSTRKVLIAVMGVTGSGKSTFISTVTGNNDIKVGHGLKSCTSNIEPYSFHYHGTEITLVDTPGFNDTVRSETEVLKDIASWLASSYENDKQKLTGILYLHALERKMLGSSLRNLKMFRELCGEEPLKNVLLVTTGWGLNERSGTLSKAEDHERELREDKALWQPMVARGATMMRFRDTRSSAVEILSKVLDRNPVVLQIQSEMVDKESPLAKTSAGQIVIEGMEQAEEDYKKQLAQIEEEMNEALALRDEELQQVLNDSRLQMENLRREAEYSRKRLEYDWRTQRQENELLFQALREGFTPDVGDFDDVKTQIRANEGKLRPEERKVVNEIIDEAEKKEEDRKESKKAKRRKDQKRRGLLLMIKIILGVGSFAASLLVGFPIPNLGSFIPTRSGSSSYDQKETSDEDSTDYDSD